MDSDLAAWLREEMTESLRSSGALVSARWVQAFKSVPRHEFLAEFFAPADQGAAWRLVTADDGDDWLRMAYADEAWVTQIDGDREPPRRWGNNSRFSGVPTSSSSAPSLMARMLEALDVSGDSRVLELGTGTGYNAALLCAGLSDYQVSSVDVDPSLIHHAAAVLARLGYRPRLEAGDGESQAARGCDGHDRLIVTYGAPRIAAGWLSILATGGLIVVPLHRELSPGMVIRLITGDRIALGRFLPFYGAFMPTRRRAAVDLPAALGADRRGEGTTVSSELPELAFGTSTEPWQDYAALVLGDVHHAFVLPDGSDDLPTAQQWLFAPDGSWARQQPRPGGGSTVTQSGARRLWTELEAAVKTWRAMGEPRRDRLGLTVTPRAQELWVDDPGHVIQEI